MDREELARHQVRMEFSEYLETIQNPQKRWAVESLVRGAVPVLRAISRRQGGRDTKSEVYVTADPNPNATAAEGYLEFSSGLLDQFLGLEFPYVEKVIPGIPADRFLRYLLVSVAGLTWVIAHEIYHLIKKHSEVEETVAPEAKRLTSWAFEIDSDLNGASEVFRLCQHTLGGDFGDIQIRQLVFYFLFWTMRPLPRSGTETHPPMVRRIWHVFTKLCTLSEDPAVPPDNSVVREETLLAISALWDTLQLCEGWYQRQHSGQHDVGNLGEEMMSFLQQHGSSEFTQTWHSISGEIEKRSGTPTDVSIWQPDLVNGTE